MFDVLMNLLSRLSFFFILHVTNTGAFPKPLSDADERYYLKRAAEGDVISQNILVEHNLRLVAHIVKKYYNTGTDPDDLVSIGTIGLIKAIKTFKMDKKIRLSSYASRCIENEILMYFRSNKKSSFDISINEEIDSDADGNALTLMDIMSVEDSIVDDLDTKMKSECLPQYINQALSDREKEIIQLRYGTAGNRPLTQREVAQRLGISRSYVSRIEKKALTALRRCFERK